MPRPPVARIAYSPRELAEALGVTRPTVQTWIARGYVPSVKIGGKRFIAIDVFDRLVAEAEAQRPAKVS